MTFIAGLRLGGMTAPWVLEGAMDGDAFRVYVRDVLAPQPAFVNEAMATLPAREPWLDSA